MAKPAVRDMSAARPVLGRVDGIGHSLLTDYGTTLPDWATMRRLSAALGVGQLRLTATFAAILSWPQGSPAARSGDGGWAYILNRLLRNEQLVAPYSPKSQAAVVQFGINDLAQLGPRVADLIGFKEGYRTLLSALRQAARWEAEALPASITYPTGTWATDNSSGGTTSSGNGLRDFTALPASFTITTPADFPANGIVAIGTVPLGAWGAAFNVTIDGAGAGTFDNRNRSAVDFGGTPASNARYTGVVWRSPPLSAGAHTITFTATAVTTVFYLDYWAIEPPVGQGPAIVCLLENRPLDAGYNNYATNFYQRYTSTLSATANAGASTFSVASPLTGAGGGSPTIKVGDTITLEYGGGNAETVTVQAITGTGPWTITPASPAAPTTPITLARTHASGTSLVGGLQDFDLTNLNQQIKDVVAEFADPLIVYADADPLINKNATMFGSDGLHYNELGHRQKTSLLVKTLANLPLTLDNLIAPTVPDRQTWVPVLITAANVASVLLQNSWTAFGGTEPIPQFYKDTFTNVIRLRGAIKGGTSPTAAIFTLPVGYRPANDIVLEAWSAKGPATLLVTAAGVVSMYQNGDTSYSAFECSFLSENP